MTKLIFIAASLIILTTSCGENRQAGNNEKSEEKTKKHDTLDAVNKLIKENPGNAELYITKARILESRGNLNQAEAEIDRALKADSTIADHHAYKADILFEMQRIRESMEAAQKALKIDETHISANKRMAWIYFILEDYENTFKYVNKVLAEDEHDAECYYIKGMAYKEQEKLKLSVSSFRTAVEQDNEYYDAWVQLGLLHSIAEHEHTVFYYDNAIKADSTHYEARYNKAYYLQETEGNYRAAIDEYDAIIRHNPNFYNAYFNKGYIYLKYLNEYDSAQMMFTRVTQINPASYKAYLNRALAYERQGDLERALEDVNKTLKMRPDWDLAAEAKTRITGKL